MQPLLQPKLPPWLKIRLNTDGQYANVQAILREQNLHTVCESAHCPNRPECFRRGTATVMILGNICTRRCGFCAVEKGTPAPVDHGEPRRVAELIKKLSLHHAVITSVTRDDLPDGGASVFAATIKEIRTATRNEPTIEVLTPDFKGSEEALAAVLESAPDIFNHNLETVERLQATVRPQANYRRSLNVLKFAATSSQAGMVKSGLMAGMGETDAELYGAMHDLIEAGCRYLTIGQYLAPSRKHLPVDRFVPPALFEAYREHAFALGFRKVASAPLVRSSYMAERFFDEADSRN